MQKIAKLLCLLISFVLLTSCGTSQTVMSTNHTVQLYFVDNETLSLVPIDFHIDKIFGQQTAEKVLDELIKGRDSDKKIKRLIPNISDCMTVTVKNDIAYINLTDKFVSNIPDGRDLEVLVVYSIVNSITSIDGIRAVRFVIDGKEQENLKGYIDMRETFIPDYTV